MRQGACLTPPFFLLFLASAASQSIINRLPPTGYYSQSTCRNEVSSYFRQYSPSTPPFGFVSSHPFLTDLRESSSLTPSSFLSLLPHIEDFCQKFAEEVDVLALFAAAAQRQGGRGGATAGNPSGGEIMDPERRGGKGEGGTKSRKDIEREAAEKGAAGGG